MEDKRGGLASLKRLDALQLKLIAMALMLSDHIWYVFLQDKGIAFEWMTWIGRLAFPIFAFQIVEGFVHTHNFWRYWRRMILFALVSEIPFNLAFGGGLHYPDQQNVMFTFSIALPLLALIRKSREKGGAAYPLTFIGCALLGYFLGHLAQVDYYGDGVLVVLLFYLFRDLRFRRIGELATLAFINLGTHAIRSVRWFYISLSTCILTPTQQTDWAKLGGWEFPLPHIGPGFVWAPSDQALAVLALIPIWMYNGKQGRHSRALQYACYAFYPVHLLILGLLAKVI